MAFSVKEVCEIIRTCRKQGVTQIQLGDLKLEMGDTAAIKSEGQARPLTPEEQKLADEYAAKELAQQEYELRQEELARLRLEDPESYEDLMMRGELTDVRKEPEGT